MEKIANGVYKMTFGTTEEFTFSTFREFEMKQTDSDNPAPFDEGSVVFKATKRGCSLRLPQLGEVYGLGLQLTTFKHNNAKRSLRCNADPRSTSGETHAPVPFYVTTAGYGVFIDSARDVDLYFGQAMTLSEIRAGAQAVLNEWSADSTFAAYEGATVAAAEKHTLVEIPVAQGVDVYLFAGDDMLDAVCKYGMFCGGGAELPAWGLGSWYRIYGQASAQAWADMAQKFTDDDLPVTVLGLEPGWQTHAYSCSFVYDDEKRGDTRAAIQKMHDLGYKVNLWEHCYTHPTSPLFEPLTPYAGDYGVWGGLVPDFATQEARKIYQDYHKTLGADCFKLDECDGSDLTGGWSFPNDAQFPSGLDGEQMHHLLGLLYQQTLHEAFPNSRHSVRAAGALAAPYPFILYSDLYAHKDFIRGVVNAGFSGLLWAPEVRDAESLTDFVRRMQTALFSPQMLINAWYLKNPPWEQMNTEKNLEDVRMEEADEATALTRDLLKTRMAFVPYLEKMYKQYHDTGKPVFRALVLDYPKDAECLTLDDEYLMGDDYLFAPLTAADDSRAVYLPAGKWERDSVIYEAGWHEFTCKLNEYLLFKKA